MKTFEDYSENTILTFDLITESGEMIADHLSFTYMDIQPLDYSGDDLYKSKYMFQTFRLMNGGFGYYWGEFAFGEEWETSAVE